MFTGWAAVGEYRSHRPLAAYLNLEANAQLALDGSLGHVTEVLSGDYYQPLSTSSPHQVWSAAMVINPVLRGLFGLETRAEDRRLILSPHIPADWTSFALHHVRVGDAELDLDFERSFDDLRLAIHSTGQAVLEFSPALSLRAQVLGAELNSKSLSYRIVKSDFDQHVAVQAPLEKGAQVLRIRVKNDFGIGVPPSLPPLGSRSRGLRVVSETWSAARDQLALDIAGAGGLKYELSIWNPAEIASVEGATLDGGKLVAEAPVVDRDPYPQEKIVIHFKGRR